jgi:hypothetical protein
MHCSTHAARLLSFKSTKAFRHSHSMSKMRPNVSNSLSTFDCIITPIYQLPAVKHDLVSKSREICVERKILIRGRCYASRSKEGLVNRERPSGICLILRAAAMPTRCAYQSAVPLIGITPHSPERSRRRRSSSSL